MSRIGIYGTVILLVTGVSVSDVRVSRKGPEIPPGKLPYLVDIEIDGLDSCRGSIISYKFVLTSGTCSEFAVDKFKIYPDPALETNRKSVYMVKRKILHSDFRSQKGNGKYLHNVALLEVNPPFEFEGTVSQIPLSEIKIRDGILAITIGWVYNKKKGTKNFGTVSSRMRTAIVIDKEECRRLYKDLAEITENEICTQPVSYNRYKKTCQMFIVISQNTNLGSGTTLG